MRKLFILLAFLFLLPLPVLATDYTCRVCYEPVSADKVVCETLMSPTLEGVQNMVIAAVEFKSGLDKVTIDCSFPSKTEKGYTGYVAEIKLRK